MWKCKVFNQHVSPDLKQTRDYARLQLTPTEVYGGMCEGVRALGLLYGVIISVGPRDLPLEHTGSAFLAQVM